MSRYIDADRLIDDIKPFAEYDSNRSNKDWVRRFEIAIDDQPTADVRENVRGEWIEKHYTINCSVCKKCLWSGPYIDLVKKFNFCPNCGADMRPITALSENAEIDSNDVVEVVRCKDCKYRENKETWFACTYWNADPYEQPSVNDNDFCSYGERAEE